MKARQAEIAAQLEAMEALREELIAEDVEIETAIKVVLRFEEKNVARNGSAAEHARAEERDAAEGERGKPEKAPTMPEMILAVLIQAKKEGRRGLEPKEIKPLIATRWWPEVPANVISSIAWRMWKRGQIAKDGQYYMLAQTNEAAGTPN